MRVRKTYRDSWRPKISLASQTTFVYKAQIKTVSITVNVECMWSYSLIWIEPPSDSHSSLMPHHIPVKPYSWDLADVFSKYLKSNSKNLVLWGLAGTYVRNCSCIEACIDVNVIENDCENFLGSSIQHTPCVHKVLGAALHKEATLLLYCSNIMAVSLNQLLMVWNDSM